MFCVQREARRALYGIKRIELRRLRILQAAKEDKPENTLSAAAVSRHEISDETKNEIVELRRQGMKLYAIASKTGVSIDVVDGKEVYDASRDLTLPPEAEHAYPDYSLYPELTKDTAYGFLTRGCPRGCGFCHVAAKEGRRSYKVADLSEFWNGQKYIKLLDPNLLACDEHMKLLQQLIDSRAYVDFTQGLDIRLVNNQNVELLKKIKVSIIHFAWDNPADDLKKNLQISKRQHNIQVAN